MTKNLDNKLIIEHKKAITTQGRIKKQLEALFIVRKVTKPKRHSQPLAQVNISYCDNKETYHTTIYYATIKKLANIRIDSKFF